MIKVKPNKDYYKEFLDWLYDTDRDHLMFVDTLSDLYRSFKGIDPLFQIPTLAQIAKTDDWRDVMLKNYRIHLTLMQFMQDLGLSLEPPIIVVPKILFAHDEFDLIYKEYLMHRDIEQYIILLGGE